MTRTLFTRRGLLTGAALLAALPAFPGLAVAQPFPSKPVTLVVPFPAGGTTATRVVVAVSRSTVNSVPSTSTATCPASTRNTRPGRLVTWKRAPPRKSSITLLASDASRVTSSPPAIGSASEPSAKRTLPAAASC